MQRLTSFKHNRAEALGPGWHRNLQCRICCVDNARSRRSQGEQSRLTSNGCIEPTDGIRPTRYWWKTKIGKQTNEFVGVNSRLATRLAKRISLGIQRPTTKNQYTDPYPHISHRSYALLLLQK